MSVDQRMDQICDEFERLWQSGEVPCVFDFLKQVENEQRLELLQHLLSLDIECRDRFADLPQPEEYAIFGATAVRQAAEVITELKSRRASALHPFKSIADDATLVKANPSDTSEGGVVDSDATLIPPSDEFATLAPASSSHNSTSQGSTVRYFGDYELLEEIARGGMGVVYKARQVNLNRVVALKMILAGQLASEEEVQRFRTEAESAANLDHPGIVPIYEIGQHESQHFFSMGYVEGQSLADRVRNGPLPPKEAAELTKKIAEAIAFAHSRNVIHRDLKPANVLLDQNGEPKVTDFGLARKTDNDSGMTRTGAVMGTPSYMPPEQAAGKTSEVGPLSDVYSLGAILYCLLTGRPPFQAANPLDTLLQVMEREPVSVSTINPEIQRDLETICHKCLQKEPFKRYASARELAEDLGRWLRGEPIYARAISSTERAYRWVRRNPVISALSTATAMAMIIGTVVSLRFGISADNEAQKAKTAERNAREAEASARQSEATAIATRETTEATLAHSNYLLAKGQWSANRVKDALNILYNIPPKYRNFEWHCAQVEFDGSQFCLYHRRSVKSICFSPDGKFIVSGDLSGNISIWDIVTGIEIKRLDAHQESVNSLSFSPDGLRFASGGGDYDSGEVKIWDCKSGLELATFDGHENGVLSVDFSPDGGQLVSGSWDKTVRIWDVSQRVQVMMFNSLRESVSSVRFSPDGRRVAAGGGTTIKIWDTATRAETATIEGHSLFISDLNFSPDGSYLASASGTGASRGELILWDAFSGNEIKRFGEPNGAGSDGSRNSLDTAVNSVGFSPDGRQIVSGSGFMASGEVQLWDIETGRMSADLRGHLSGVDSVQFSPDGARIASGSVEGTVKLWDVTADKSRMLRLHDHGTTSFTFLADNRHLVSSGAAVRKFDLQTGEEVMTINATEFSRFARVCCSADGKQIAASVYSFQPPGEVVLWDAISGEETLRLRCDESSVECISFSPDGNFLASGGADATVRIWDLATSKEVLLLRGIDSGFTDVAFSPDGTLIGAVAGNGAVHLWHSINGSQVEILEGEFLNASCVNFSPDGKYLVVGSLSGRVTVYDAVNYSPIRILESHTSGVTSVSFSPNGTRIVSSSGSFGVASGELILWDSVKGDEITRLRELGPAVSNARFSPDGMQLAYATGEAGQASDLVVLGSSRPKEFTVLSGHDHLLAQFSFSPDGDLVSTGSFDGVAKIWKLSTGEHLGTGDISAFLPLESVMLSPDKRWFPDYFTGKHLRVIDMTLASQPLERARRQFMAEPKIWWHREESVLARSAADHYSALFHSACLLREAKTDAWLFDDLQEDYRKLLAAHGGKAPSVPNVVVDMLKVPRGDKLPQLNRDAAWKLDSEVQALASKPTIEGGDSVSYWHLQRLKDICTHFPDEYSFHLTIGIVQYRLGQYEEALESLEHTLQLLNADSTEPIPSPVVLAFQAMSHYRSGRAEQAGVLRSQMLRDAAHPDNVFDPDLQAIMIEVQSTLDGPDTVKHVGNLEDFEREGTFEGLVQHRWRFLGYYMFSASSYDPHQGKECLQAVGQFGAVMAHQTVSVLPNSRYRLTGWIRSRLEVPEALAASKPEEAVGSDIENPAPLTDPPALESSEPTSPAVGACFAILNREDTSEIISGVTDWKQVTVEFTTGDETTITLGCRLGMPDQSCTGRAWFDDLKLEEIK